MPCFYDTCVSSRWEPTRRGLDLTDVDVSASVGLLVSDSLARIQHPNKTPSHAMDPQVSVLEKGDVDFAAQAHECDLRVRLADRNIACNTPPGPANAAPIDALYIPHVRNMLAVHEALSDTLAFLNASLHFVMRESFSLAFPAKRCPSPYEFNLAELQHIRQKFRPMKPIRKGPEF
jgi:hypothetical protein